MLFRSVVLALVHRYAVLGPDHPSETLSSYLRLIYGARQLEQWCEQSVLIVGGISAVERFSAWIDAKPGRFRLVLAAHSMIVAAILLTTFHG